MNTAVRTLSQSHAQAAMPSLLSIKHPHLVNIALIILLLLSAFVVVYLKDLNRRLFFHVHSLQASHDQLYEEWEKLLLEQSTWSSQARVQKIAKQHLSMNLPSSQEVVVLKLHP